MLGLLFGEATRKGDVITGYVDSDFVGSLDTRKSLMGSVFTAYGGVVSWKANLQSVVALSTIEVEYIAMKEAAKESMRLLRLANELKIEQKTITLFCDNQSTIHLSKTQVFH